MHEACAPTASEPDQEIDSSPDHDEAVDTGVSVREAIEQLDRQWSATRAGYVFYPERNRGGWPGAPTLPDEWGMVGVVFQRVMVLILAGGMFSTTLDEADSNTVLMFILFAGVFVWTARTCLAVRQYHRAKTTYEMQRKALLSRMHHHPRRQPILKRSGGPSRGAHNTRGWRARRRRRW